MSSIWNFICYWSVLSWVLCVNSLNPLEFFIFYWLIFNAAFTILITIIYFIAPFTLFQLCPYFSFFISLPNFIVIREAFFINISLNASRIVLRSFLILIYFLIFWYTLWILLAEKIYILVFVCLHCFAILLNFLCIIRVHIKFCFTWTLLYLFFIIKN